MQCRTYTKLTSQNPQPYKFIEKWGNTVVIQKHHGQLKMRNAAHVTKFNSNMPHETSIHSMSESDQLSPAMLHTLIMTTLQALIISSITLII